MKISEDIPQNNFEKEIIQNNNSSDKNFVNQIDDIINKYKTQLQQLKTNTNPINQEKNIEILPQLTTISKNSGAPLLITSSPDSRKVNPNINQIPLELTKELENDNLKLQSALTAEKLNVVKLTSKLESYELELNKAKEEIIELQNQLANKENEFINHMNNITNNINYDIDKMKNEIISNKNIIQKFFELFNKNVELFNKSKIFYCDRNTKIIYLENDFEGNNQKLSAFVINSLDILINKLLKDNKELYEQLIDVKKILDEQNNIQRELDGMKGLREENLILKEQLQTLVQENNICKKENQKFKNEIKDYINKLNNNKINENNIQIPLNKMVNYKKNRVNSHHEQNHIYNKNNYNNYNNSSINKNRRELKNIKDYYNSTRNIKSNITINNDINNKSNINIRKNITINTNKSYCNTSEDRKINNNDYSIDINFNKTYDNCDSENRQATITGFEEPLEHLKNKIFLLEKQLKNNSNQ